MNYQIFFASGGAQPNLWFVTHTHATTHKNIHRILFLLKFYFQ